MREPFDDEGSYDEGNDDGVADAKNSNFWTGAIVGIAGYALLLWLSARWVAWFS